MDNLGHPYIGTAIVCLIYIYNTLILYYTVCNYTRGPGEAVNAACNACDLNDICLRDIPCQNGG